MMSAVETYESAEFGLLRPCARLLPALVEALARVARTDDDPRRRSAALAEIATIERDSGAYLALLDDPEAKGPPVLLPDGSTVPRLPGYRLWIWDGEYAGGISLRWRSGTVDLPPTYLGHIGYDVMPWKRRRGYATRALALMLPHAAALGLPHAEITADPDNVGSRRAIEKNGGEFVEIFEKPAALGGGPCVRYRIALGGRSKNAAF